MSCEDGQIVGLCPHCLKVTQLTRHHIYPRRFFGCYQGSPILHICRRCHDLIEKLIPQRHKLERYEYEEIARDFLRERYSSELSPLQEEIGQVLHELLG